MGDDYVSDKRIEWIRDRVVPLLKTKPEYFDKLTTTEEGEVIKRFVNEDGITKLFFTAGAKDMTVSEKQPDDKSKKKAVFAFKTGEYKYDEKKLDEMFDTCICADMSPLMLNNLYGTLRNVYLPILSNPNNTQGWPEVVMKAFHDKYNWMLAAVNTAVGQTQGKTFLWLPPVEPPSSSSGGGRDRSDKDRVHVLESAVVMWTERINTALSRNPESVFGAVGTPSERHPGPIEGIDFWQGKYIDLGDIIDQLGSPQIVKVLKVLEIIRSPYYNAFKQLINQLQIAHAEAKDNIKYLEAQRQRFTEMLQADYSEIADHFKPIMHVLLLIWKHSKFYNTPPALALLLRMTCNDVIEKSRDFLGGTAELFNAEPKEAVENINVVLDVCRTLKADYYTYYALSKTQCESNPWMADRGNMFKRLDLFITRCEDLLHLCRTAQQFEKLITVVIGGNAGAGLTQDTENIAKQFDAALNKMKELQYDVLDVANTQFEADITTFAMAVKELETRIAKVLGLGFEDCSTVSAGFKLVDSFGDILERDFVQADLEAKHLELIRIYAEELKNVQELFTRDRDGAASKGKFFERDGPPLYVNMPPVSGALAWVQGLIRRLEDPMKSLQTVLRLMEDTDEVKDVKRMYDSIIKVLQDYEDMMFSAWEATVDTTLGEKLTLPLLTRDPKSLELAVNFDAQLTRLLSECKYFTIQKKTIPEIAQLLYANAELYRVQTANLTLVRNMYNEMLRIMLDVEKPLLKGSMKAIDKVLDRGLKELVWKSANPEKDAFIAEAMGLVEEAYKMLHEMKKNMNDLIAVLARWVAAPLITRQSMSKTYNLASYMEEHAKFLELRQKDITDGAKDIHALLKASNEVLKVSKGAPAWRAYVEYMNNILITGIADTVGASLAYLLAQIDPKAIAEHGKSPFFDVKLDLNASGKGDEAVFFSPPLDGPPGTDSVTSYMQSIISDFYNVVKLIKRLDRAEGDFLKEMEENETVRFHVHRIVDEMENNQRNCKGLREPFLQHRALWAKDIQATLELFLEEASIVDEATGASMPSLDLFRDRITELKEEEVVIKDLEGNIVEGWLKIDAKPTKTMLSNLSTKWSSAHTLYLKDHVHKELDDLQEFIAAVKAGLSSEVEENDGVGLINAMEHVRDVRVKQDRIDNIFEPLKGTIQLLKKFGVTMPDETNETLEMVPFSWEDTKKITLNAREMLGPLQALQQEKVREEADQFRTKVADYCKKFHEEAPFEFARGVPEAYTSMNQFHVSMSELEAEAAHLGAQQELFELAVTNWRDIKTARNELVLLKLAWDHVQYIQDIFSSFRATLWSAVDVEGMTDLTKKLQKEVKMLNKAIHKWDVHIGLTALVGAMSIALPLCGDLRDDAMRARHWTQLMQACGQTFVMDDKLQLDSLLKLELDKYQDSVSEIVERARAEIKIDLQLQKIITTWSGLFLEYVPFKASGVQILVQPGDVFEALDDNEVALQNMMGNRFVGFFETVVSEWKGKLGTVRAVLDVWLEVQRSWTQLESIFLASEDIREQLPEDAKRFDGIDSAFREQMADACQNNNPIEVCTQSGREDVFVANFAALELCQKSLSDYLEVKKKKFPRFYFISAADLVDILSKGRYAPAVQPHFSKFTDATGSIDWAPDDNGKLTGLARGCQAIDGEKFPYLEFLNCEGAVEDWLLELMKHQAAMFRLKVKESLDAYIDMPREKWIDSYGSQHCIQTGQVWWTTEVHLSFDRLEQGNENAMKEYLQQCLAGLKGYAAMVLGEMSKELRTKVKTLITIDTHAREIVEKMVLVKCDTPLDFIWQSQLKFRWPEPDDPAPKDLYINICDAQFTSRHEYVGNPGRLVITALTDRCYITLTQALRLMMGGAPQGPAGTGKTETTKDLGRGLSIWVIVSNCSDQMNNKVTGNFFSGLAQTGAWGCFDEFNRITVEVLSVVATQYGSILMGIRAGKERFMFEEEEINLVDSIGAWITMNPGYAGRAELPENLKALFRPCAMVTPNFENIAEINLAGEGFVESKNLANKFVTMYYVCGQLLSKQMHYDWGLRAMSGVLRIAGGMKREDPDKSEQQILMRAMRDTNLPKFVQADFGIFLGVINDLYPKVDCPAIINPSLKKGITDVIADPEEKWWGTLGRPALQAEENFVIKTINLFEALSVRHCVFVLGTAGAAKSELWKTLAAAQSYMGMGGGNSLYNALNPKAVTSNELYGYVHPVTKEPYDGVIAKIMRDFAAVPSDHKNINVPKWMVLDGDIDAEWIESMNTVMDDNRILTLTTNERIPLTASMKLLLEISHLRNASPATASRAGCVFLNESDIGWRPYVQTWVETMGDAKAQTILESLFEQFVAPTLSMIAKEKWRHLTPIKDFAVVEVICRILEALLTPDSCPAGSEKDVYEAYFQFAAVWAIGGAFGSDKGADFRKQFDGYWRTEFAKCAMRFPDEGTIFDFFIDPTTKKGEPKRCTHWREIVPTYTHDRAEAYARIFVPTLDSTRLLYFGNMMMKLRKPVMYIGNSGSAKTIIINTLLKGLDEDEWLYNIISYNSFSISGTVQPILEAPLEKKTGTIFGPPGTKKLIYFIDDFNMPSPDKYGTQSAIAILRQHKDYGGFYDLKTLRMKRLDNTLYLTAMNPTAGSFFIIDRMQRHFCTLGTPFPDAEVLAHIYKNILGGHFEIFNEGIREVYGLCIDCVLGIHQNAADTFIPSAVKFHYQWNLRALASVFQGLFTTSPATYKDPMRLARLTLHECTRVYSDRMVLESDCEKFAEVLLKNAKQFLGTLDQEALTAEPIIYATFVEESEGDQKMYLPVEEGWDQLSKLLTKQLNLYNESFAMMNLVLFNQAMEHISRISRIIDNPRGNAMLVGVGGSGKQSLTRLAAFIGGCEIFSIKLTSSYNIVDWKEDLRNIYMKAGVKAIPTVFLFTDQQIFKEGCLIFLNDILALGYPPGLFAEEDRDTICNGVRNDAKAAGYMDAKESLWEFFINRVRSLLHLCICMSPVGDNMRNRCRKFPALTSCSAINWFFNWPQQALISVGAKFLEDIEMESDAVKKAVSEHMAFVHESVGVSAERYRAMERREIYTTPKSYLELIALYKDELTINRDKLQVLKDQLVEGLLKLDDAEQQVADMQITLKEEAAFVATKSKETDELIIVVGKESIIAEEEGAKAAIEEAEVNEIAIGVAEFQVQANKDLAAAEPAIEKAMAALGGLNKNALGELKGLATPPAAVLAVTAAVTYMIAPKGANLKKLDITWGGAKKVMGDVAKFLEQLQNYDKDNFDLAAKAMVRQYTGSIPDPKGENPMGLTMGHPAGDGSPNPEFNYEYMKGKSSAAAGLCDWIVNICIYHDIYLDVAPKRAKLNAAEAELAAANKKLAGVRAHVAALDQKMKELTEMLETATNEKNALVAKAEATQKRANLANRLVNGLGSEGARWKSDVGKLDEMMRLLVGDVLLSSSFVAYIGPFSREFRDDLVDQKWKPDMATRAVPLTEGFDPMKLLTDASKTAGWQAEGLPADPLSTQNAAIICKCARFPMIIDPQLQAVDWIKGREAANGLVMTVPGAKGWLDKVVKALEEGLPLLLENMPSVVEAILDNLVARAYVRKGTKVQVYLGDRGVDLPLKKQEEGDLSDPVPEVKVYMQSRLPNPHYIPEVQAQTTLVNFTVTEKGLEDQLLSTVVGHERPDLLAEAKELVEMQNGFTIKLKELGDNLLYLLATAEGDILANEALIITLEETKVTVTEINAKQVVAAKKEIEIAKTFELYRPDAARGSLIYFLMNKINVMGPMYQYSLGAFNFIFYKALDKAAQPEEEGDVGKRVELLLASVTYTLFKFVSSGLFERHRLTFSTQLAINIMRSDKDSTFKMQELDLLVQSPKDNSKENPVAAWLPDECWGACCALALAHEEFAALPADLEGSWKRWKEWSDHPTPELEPLPTDWKRLGGFQQLLIMRAIRPDRINLALKTWVVSVLGPVYGEAINFNLPVSFEDSGPATPIFFLLSPGVDATSEVRSLGLALKPVMSEDEGRLITVSLGQGQEPVAEKALDQMYTDGGWAMLENIELVAGWLPKLEKKLESLELGSDPLFRCYLSAMPQPVVPVPILQKSIKLTNEPPTGLKANLKRAYLLFNDTLWENSSKQGEFKTIVFALCFFHSVVCERRKFGPLGWNRGYPFNPGDLKDSIAVANNYLEGGSTIPWDDLRYLFGEIFYGGHITDNYDRALCTAYLLAYVRVELLEGIQMFPGFPSPPTLNYKGYLEYIEDGLERETPIAYGLHPNAEINFMTMQAAQLFSDISNLSPKDGGGGEGGMTESERVKLTLDDILERLPDLFGMLEVMERIEEVTPYTGVFLQECERMNTLIFEVRRSLVELDSGLKGDLSITEPMEKLIAALSSYKVPMSWEKLAWASRDALAGWLSNLLARQIQLMNWTGDLALPKVTWVAGLFNTQAFVNAIMQVTSRKNDWALNKLVTTVDVTKKMTPEEVEAPTRDGAYLYGLYMEGARWDTATGCLEDSYMKELYPKMPVIQMKSILAEKEDRRGVYLCPVYKQTERATPGTATPGSGFVFMMQLKTKQPAAKWTMAGVAMLLAID